jgi:hypothetical protein
VENPNGGTRGDEQAKVSAETKMAPASPADCLPVALLPLPLPENIFMKNLKLEKIKLVSPYVQPGGFLISPAFGCARALFFSF